jgi:3-oxoacyl-[acyl-carrier protein] reductase
MGLTKSWAKELAPWNICVNSVAPGAVKTKMQPELDSGEEMQRYLEKIPLRRFAEPEEMSYAVLFLASSESNFITGQILSPNGGDTIVGI